MWTQNALLCSRCEKKSKIKTELKWWWGQQHERCVFSSNVLSVLRINKYIKYSLYFVLHNGVVLALAEQKSIGMDVYEYVVCTRVLCMGFVYYAKNANTKKKNRKKSSKKSTRNLVQTKIIRTNSANMSDNAKRFLWLRFKWTSMRMRVSVVYVWNCACSSIHLYNMCSCTWTNKCESLWLSSSLLALLVFASVCECVCECVCVLIFALFS